MPVIVEELPGVGPWPVHFRATCRRSGRSVVAHSEDGWHLHPEAPEDPLRRALWALSMVCLGHRHRVR